MNDDDTNSSPNPGDFSRWIEPSGAARAAVILLHGLDMNPGQLAPLLRSLKLPAWVALPAGPIERPDGHRSWWPVDDAARATRLGGGPFDLHASYPPGRERARARVHDTAAALSARAPGLPLVIGGFSQGAMLALDCALQSPGLPVDALALWSGSRLAFSEWAPALHRLRGIPVDLVHGRQDANLSIEAAAALRDALVAEGAQVRWTPFEGGHEIPLQAWFGLRRLVREVGGSP